MRVSVKCSSAIHILLMIAMRQEGQKITSEFLASSVGSNPVEIRRLLSSLKKAGMIDVARGPGGAALKKEPGEITLLDIYTAVDPASLSELIGIHQHAEKRCPFGRNMAELLSEPYAEIGSAVQQKMSEITLERLCMRLREMEPAFQEA